MTDANTPAQDIKNEQAAIKPVEEETSAREIVEEPASTPAKPAEEKVEKTDTRAARMEALADRRREAAEVAPEPAPEDQAGAVAEQPAKAAREAPAPQERMIKLKIRGEIVELPESEVIARAQKVDAADSYLADARNLLEDAKRTTKPAPEKKPEPEKKPDAIAKAIEIIQTGGDPAEARAILDTELTDRSTSAAERVMDGREYATRARTYDGDLQTGYTEAGEDIQKFISALPPEQVANGSAAVNNLVGGMQRSLIAELLPTLPANVQDAFSGAGITAETILNYTPQDAGALYKDMALKGYALPRPGAVVKAAASAFAQKYSGTTKPAAPTTAQPAQTLDRTARKEQLQQPERTTIPKPTTQTPPPRTEAQRAVNARQEMRAGRRKAG